MILLYTLDTLSALSTPETKKRSKQKRGELTHHTKELLAYQQPLVRRSGGKKKEGQS